MRTLANAVHTNQKLAEPLPEVFSVLDAPDLPQRLQRKISVDKASECWLWEGAGYPYGQAWWEGRVWPVHRITYTTLIADIPEGYWIDHLCEVKKCCNPEHLEAVTPAENTRRAGTYAKATKPYCIHGHPMVPENLYHWQQERRCRACRKAVSRRAYERSLADANTR